MQMAPCVDPHLIQEWYAAWNRRDWDAIESSLADFFVLEDMALGRIVHGKREYLDYSREYADSFPEGHVKLDRILSGAGGVVVAEYSLEGTRFCDILKYEHGKLVSCRTYGGHFGPLGDKKAA